MTNRSAASLVLKIQGILWLVHSVSLFFNTGLQLAHGHFETDQSLWMYAVRSGTLAATFTFLVGLALLRGGDAIARAVFPKEESLAVDVDGRRLQTIGFSLLALYFAMSAVRSIVVGLYGLLTKPASESVEYIWTQNREHLVASLVELGASVLLFFGTPALVRFGKRLQEPWTKQAAESPDEAADETHVPDEPPE